MQVLLTMTVYDASGNHVETTTVGPMPESYLPARKAHYRAAFAALGRWVSFSTLGSMWIDICWLEMLSGFAGKPYAAIANTDGGFVQWLDGGFQSS